MKLIKITLSLILAMVLTIQPALGINTRSLDASGNSEATVSIVCDTDIDLKGIEIEVYRSVLAYSDITADYYEYDEELAFVVKTNSNGVAVFNRPSECFSITVRLGTLPEKYGINSHTYFFNEKSSDYRIEMGLIENIGISKDNGEYSPVFTDASGNALYAACEVTKNEDKAGCIIDTGKKTITYNETVNVLLYGNTHSFTNAISYEYRNGLERVGFLYECGLIPESEYIEYICDYMQNNVDDSEFGQDSGVIDGTALYWTVRNYYEANRDSLDKSLSQKIQGVLSPSSQSSPTKSASQVTSANGRFIVYYDTTKCSAAVAQAVANKFDAVDAMFYTNWGFRRPYYSFWSLHYYVHLIDLPPTENGNTPMVGSQGSEINISYNTAIEMYNRTGQNLNNTDVYAGVLAHEYMHAIFYRYGISYDTNDRIWMHECFAEWAGFAFENDYGELCTYFVGKFLRYPEYSLNYFTSTIPRHYGSMLFPLYIQQQMGGYTRIKKMLELYSNSNNPLTAVNSGLQYYGYSLSGAYINCAAYNFDTAYYYNGTPSNCYSWNNASNLLPTQVQGVKTLPMLSSNYIMFEAQENVICTLTATINFTSGSNNAALKSIRTSDSNTNYITDCTISNNRCTIVHNSFGAHIAKLITIIPNNKSTAGTVTYTLTYSIS